MTPSAPECTGDKISRDKPVNATGTRSAQMLSSCVSLSYSLFSGTRSTYSASKHCIPQNLKNLFPPPQKINKQRNDVVTTIISQRITLDGLVFNGEAIK